MNLPRSIMMNRQQIPLSSGIVDKKTSPRLHLGQDTTYLHPERNICSMSDKILKRVRLLERKNRKPLSEDQAKALSKRIEKLLHKVSPSLQTSTNDISLEQIRSLLAQRRDINTKNVGAAKISTDSFGENQIEPLHNSLDPQRMEIILHLVQQVRHIRSNNTSWAGILRATRSTDRSRHGDPDLPIKMPQELYAIYFRTRLVEAFSHVSNLSNGLIDPGMYDWDALIDEATANIAAFHNLESSHQKIIADTPVTCCIGNICSREGTSAKSA